MRLLYLVADRGIPLFGTKGASVHVQSLTRAFRQIRSTPWLWGVLRQTTPPAAWDIPVRSLPARAGGLVLSAQRDLGRTILEAEGEIRAFGPDLILERYSLFSTGGLRLARRLGVPFLLEANAPLSVERTAYGTLDHAASARRTERALVRAADLLLPVSRGMAEYLMELGAPPERIRILPNGVDTECFAPRPADRDLGSSLGLRTGEPVLGFVGSLKPWHGVELLIEVTGTLRRRGIPLHLLIVGEGPMRENLTAQAAAAGVTSWVHFTGAVPHAEVPRYLSLMTVTAAPYRPTPGGDYFSPLKVMEAMAAGVPVFASPIGALKDLIQPGENGVLLPRDRDLWADRLEDLLGDPAALARLGKAAQESAGKRSWQSVAAEIRTAGQQLVGAGTAGGAGP